MAWRQMVEGNNESDRQKELERQARGMNPLLPENLSAFDYLFGVPMRTGIRSMQEGNFNPAGQLGSDVWNQMRKPYKEASATAPTGEDIVEKAGVTHPLAKKVLGLGMEVAADPGLIGALGRRAIPLAGQIKKSNPLDELDAIINRNQKPRVGEPGQMENPEALPWEDIEQMMRAQQEWATKNGQAWTGNELGVDTNREQAKYIRDLWPEAPDDFVDVVQKNGDLFDRYQGHRYLKSGTDEDMAKTLYNESRQEKFFDEHVFTDPDYDASWIDSQYDEFQNFTPRDWDDLERKIYDTQGETKAEAISDFLRFKRERDEVAQIAKQTVDPAPGGKRFNEMEPMEIADEVIYKQNPGLAFQVAARKLRGEEAGDLGKVIESNAGLDDLDMREVYGEYLGNRIRYFSPDEQAPFKKAAVETVDGKLKNFDELERQAEELFDKKHEAFQKLRRRTDDYGRPDGLARDFDYSEVDVFNKHSLEDLKKLNDKMTKRVKKIDEVLERVGAQSRDYERIDSLKGTYYEPTGRYLDRTGFNSRDYRDKLADLPDERIESLYNKLKDLPEAFTKDGRPIRDNINANRETFDELMKDMAREKEIQKEMDRWKEFSEKKTMDPNEPIKVTGTPAKSMDEIIDKNRSAAPDLKPRDLRGASKLTKQQAFDILLEENARNTLTRTIRAIEDNDPADTWGFLKHFDEHMDLIAELPKGDAENYVDLVEKARTKRDLDSIYGYFANGKNEDFLTDDMNSVKKAMDRGGSGVGKTATSLQAPPTGPSYSNQEKWDAVDAFQATAKKSGVHVSAGEARDLVKNATDEQILDLSILAKHSQDSDDFEEALGSFLNGQEVSKTLRKFIDSYKAAKRRRNPLGRGGALSTAKSLAQEVFKNSGSLQYSLREHKNLYNQVDDKSKDAYDFLIKRAKQYGDTSGIDLDSIYRFMEDGLDERNLPDYLRDDLENFGPNY